MIYSQYFIIFGLLIIWIIPLHQVINSESTNEMRLTVVASVLTKRAMGKIRAPQTARLNGFERRSFDNRPSKI